MKFLFIIFSALFTVASGDEPPLVRAIVRELTHDPSSAPLENRILPGKQPPTWIVKLEILDVLHGAPELKGQVVITASADFAPQGNGRYVTPRLNLGDVGIWAIKQLADGSWAEVYSPYEVEKGTRLPLIKGRHDAYEKVFLRLSKDEASQPSREVKVQEKTPKPAPAADHSFPLEPPILKKKRESKPTTSASSEGYTSSPLWSIIFILAVAACGLLWLMHMRRS